MHSKLPLAITLIIVGCFAVAIAVWSVFTMRTRPTDARLSIVAAENFWGSIASQIGGDRVVVTSVINDPTSDPHLYESGAKDASAITTANIAITNGLGYDDFMDKILAAAPNAQRTNINAATVMQAANNANPHLWYDIPLVHKMTDAIASALVAKDSAGSSAYQQNLDAFKKSLAPLLERIRTIATQHPNAPVASTERIADYLLASANLTIKTPGGFASAIEEGIEPSPGDQTTMTNLIVNRQIRVLIYNPQAESPASQTILQLAQKNNIPIVYMTETMPANLTYQEWMAQQLDALANALNNTK